MAGKRLIVSGDGAELTPTQREALTEIICDAVEGGGQIAWRKLVESATFAGVAYDTLRREGKAVKRRLSKQGLVVPVAVTAKRSIDKLDEREILPHSRNLPARGKMVTLYCTVVGVAGSAFPVDIDDKKSVGHLKKEVKAENPATITCDAKDLQLFLAKTADGAWLDGAGAAAVALDECGHPQGCVQMDPLLWIKNVKYFGDNFQPGEGQVHVLVVVPGHVRVDIGGTAPRALKYKQQDTDGGSSTLNASYLSYWRSLQSLFWPSERIQPTKKDV
ncbi:Crinkler (CRN) family protein [Phytophthora cinnamomi]|uniref:Crinkler (CRN) family protein n=1 Tax=Phytophthora cinnamomi TaxID=4785 RepID=UPI002B2B72D6|nr:Crinkler (CRN) family protein [Phytophthora cinnamomi]WNO07192.1 CRN effector protein [Phytophthora cinnamomi]